MRAALLALTCLPLCGCWALWEFGELGAPEGSGGSGPGGSGGATASVTEASTSVSTSMATTATSSTSTSSAAETASVSSSATTSSASSSGFSNPYGCTRVIPLTACGAFENCGEPPIAACSIQGDTGCDGPLYPDGTLLVEGCTFPNGEEPPGYQRITTKSPPFWCTVPPGTPYRACSPLPLTNGYCASPCHDVCMGVVGITCQ